MYRTAGVPLGHLATDHPETMTQIARLVQLLKNEDLIKAINSRSMPIPPRARPHIRTIVAALWAEGGSTRAAQYLNLDAPRSIGGSALLTRDHVDRARQTFFEVESRRLKVIAADQPPKTRSMVSRATFYADVHLPDFWFRRCRDVLLEVRAAGLFRGLRGRELAIAIHEQFDLQHLIHGRHPEDLAELIRAEIILAA
jgi:hypothetical protein